MCGSPLLYKSLLDGQHGLVCRCVGPHCYINLCWCVHVWVPIGIQVFAGWPTLVGVSMCGSPLLYKSLLVGQHWLVCPCVGPHCYINLCWCVHVWVPIAIQVFAGWPTLVGVSMCGTPLLLGSSLLLLHCSAYLVHLTWMIFVRWEASDHTLAVLWSAASRMCSKQHAAFSCISHLASSPNISLKSKRWSHIIILTWLQFVKQFIVVVASFTFMDLDLDEGQGKYIWKPSSYLHRK